MVTRSERFGGIMACRRHGRWLGAVGAVGLLAVVPAVMMVHQYGTMAVWSPA